MKRKLLEERSCADATEGDRVQAVWDEAERHAAEKGGDLSIAWQHVPGVSEKHVFGFDGRNYGMKVCFSGIFLFAKTFVHHTLIGGIAEFLTSPKEIGRARGAPYWPGDTKFNPWFSWQKNLDTKGSNAKNCRLCCLQRSYSHRKYYNVRQNVGEIRVYRPIFDMTIHTTFTLSPLTSRIISEMRPSP